MGLLSWMFGSSAESKTMDPDERSISSTDDPIFADGHRRASDRIGATAVVMRSIIEDAMAAPDLAELRMVERKANFLTKSLANTMSRSLHDGLSKEDIKEVERLQGLARRLVGAIERKMTDFKR